MREISPKLAFCFLVALLGACSGPQPQVTSELPVLVIDQLPDYPMPGRNSDFPGGLVAALWRDGHVIRCTSPKAVGTSYVEGVVPPRQRDQFLDYLTIAVGQAPKTDGIPLHVATQSITVRRDGRKSEWTRILPDVTSAWCEVQSRLLSLSLDHSHAVDSRVAEALR